MNETNENENEMKNNNQNEKILNPDSKFLLSKDIILNERTTTSKIDHDTCISCEKQMFFCFHCFFNLAEKKYKSFTCHIHTQTNKQTKTKRKIERVFSLLIRVWI